jgi:hypothetical protein
VFSVVGGVVTRLWAGCLRNDGLIPGRDKGFFSFPASQNGLGSTLCPVALVLLGVLEWLVREVDHSCIYLCGVVQLYLYFLNEMHLQFIHITLLALTQQLNLND